MATIFVDVVSAEESIFSGEASFVALPGQEGELGILPGHVPLLTRIRPGAVRITTTEGTQENVFVAGGILEVQPDRVTVLADTAIRSKDLDEAKAKQALEEAKLHRAKAQSNMEIAKLEATMAALGDRRCQGCPSPDCLKFALGFEGQPPMRGTLMELIWKGASRWMHKNLRM